MFRLFEAEALGKFGVDWDFVPPRYTTTIFNHVWPGGYSANYYAYIWSEILAADAYAYVQEQGGLSLDVGLRYRDTVLSRGGSMEPMEIYKNFPGPGAYRRCAASSPRTGSSGDRSRSVTIWSSQPGDSTGCTPTPGDREYRVEI